MRLEPLIVLCAISSFFLISCNNSAPSVPVSVFATTTTDELVSSIPDGRDMSAVDAFYVAQEKALAWNPRAVLFEIPASRVMQRNLGLPTTGPAGWFFMFQEPGSPVEFYIQVVEGKVYGSTEAQPIIIGDPPFTYLPLALSKLPISNVDAFRIFLKNNGQEYVADHAPVDFDYRLVHLKGVPNPVWSIYDTLSAGESALLHIDAVTGDLANDPFIGQ